MTIKLNLESSPQLGSICSSSPFSPGFNYCPTNLASPLPLTSLYHLSPLYTLSPDARCCPETLMIPLPPQMLPDQHFVFCFRFHCLKFLAFPLLHFIQCQLHVSALVFYVKPQPTRHMPLFRCKLSLLMPFMILIPMEWKMGPVQGRFRGFNYPMILQFQHHWQVPCTVQNRHLS